jgi:predicted Zn-dependent protease
MEKYLTLDPNSVYMLGEKASLYQLRLRWEESLAIADLMLSHEPTSLYATGLKTTALLRLGQLKDAQVLAEGAMARDPSNWVGQSTVADIYFAQGNYAGAAVLAQKAVAQMSQTDLRDRVSGCIQLTRIAAEARLGHAARAKIAIDDFKANLPNINTISDIKKWLHPSADLADSEALYEGLRLAGISN